MSSGITDSPLLKILSSLVYILLSWQDTLLSWHCPHYFRIFISVITPSPLTVCFLFLGSASGVSLRLLLLAFYSHSRIANYHQYNYTFWVAFQPFSKSFPPTRHPHLEGLIFLSSFPQLSASRWMNGIIGLQMLKSETWKLLFIQCHCLSSESAPSLFNWLPYSFISVSNFLWSSLVPTTDLFNLSLNIATVFSIICQLDSTLFLLPGLSFLSLVITFV